MKTAGAMDRAKARMERAMRSAEQDEASESSGAEDGDAGGEEEEEEQVRQRAAAQREALLRRRPEADADSSEEDEDGEEGDDGDESSESEKDVDPRRSRREMEENTTEMLRQTLRELPLAKLAEIKREGWKGKPLHKALGLPGPEMIGAWLEGSFKIDHAAARALRHREHQEKQQARKKKVKKQRSAPMEMSSKRPVRRARRVVDVVERKVRDPRFDTLSGEVDPQKFETRYAFLNEQREEEIKDLAAAIRKDKQLRSMPSKARKRKGVRMMDDAELHASEMELSRLRQESGHNKRQRLKRGVMTEVRRKERELVAKGKKPYFLKKRELKQLELEKQYETLSKEGKLERYMEKRRKKNASKERRMLPQVGL